MKLQKPAWLSEIAGFGNSRLQDRQRSLSWEEFDRECDQVAATLVSEFPARALVGLRGANSLEYLIALFAIIRAGMVAVPFNTRLSSIEMVRLRQFTEVSAVLNPLEITNSKHEVPMEVEWIPRSVLGQDDIAVMICSSGSDGAAKAVTLTLRSLMAHAKSVAAHLGLTARDTWLVALPFFHVGGLTIPFRCLIAGASVAISESADAAEINHWIDEEQVSFISVVPTMLSRMIEQREGKPFPESVRGIIVGGGPVPSDLIRLCPQALPTYGLTEAGSMLTCAIPECGEAERMSAGSVLPDTEIRIVDEQGKELPRGEVGQIIARGPGMANGYWNAAIKTARTFRSGWLWTGDIGRVDEHGFLSVLARRTDVILSGGENIYPAEIEAALMQHVDITGAVVLPVEDEQWGQIPAALIVCRKELAEQDILQFLENRLARYKHPRKIIFADEIPLLPTGKPYLSKIRKMLAESN
jgi:O-succinylbenzoic acid--CoA ligase